MLPQLFVEVEDCDEVRDEYRKLIVEDVQLP